MASSIFLVGGDLSGVHEKVYFHSSAAVSANVPHFEILVRGNYTMQVRPNDETVTETYLLSAVQPTATLRRWSRALSDMLGRAKAYHRDRFNSYPVWLVHDIDTEGLKYALVHDYAIDILTEGLANPTFNHGQGLWSVAITRQASFERPRTDSFELMIVDNKEDVSASAGKWYTAPDFDYPGDLHGRIEQMRLTYSVNQAACFWAGWRPIRDDTWTFGDFVGWIQCESGIAGADTAVGSDPDKTASGSSTMVTNFATASTKTIIGRMALKASDFAADSDIYVGSYKVLLRARLNTVGAEVGLQMQIRYGDNPSNPAVSTSYAYYKATHTDYTLIEMGEMTLPPHPFRRNAADVTLGDFYIVFRAEKVTLEPIMYWDAVALIPAEHYCKLEIADPANVPSTSSTRIYTDEDGKHWAAVIDENGAITQQITPDVKNWVYPRRQGMLVVAALEGTNRVHSLNRTMDIELRIHPRFQSHWEDDAEEEGGG